MDEPTREEFRAYVAARSTSLLRTAYLLTGNRADAEDLLQTTLAKTFLSWERIRDQQALDAYVRRVMVNTQTSFWRRRRPELLLDQLPDSGVPDRTGHSDLHEALWSALGTLPKRQRAMVVLRYYEDLSEAETAAALGVSTGTVKSTTSRALAKLRDNSGLRDYPDDPRTVLPHGAMT
ncbi:MAG: polymerase, sigma-24 subunit, subfamily [Frankiales bacterium]|nr:polymerase, sigma-24 subunit, subfamily [Frankiales bacterium]